jgi:hypothetical protein
MKFLTMVGFPALYLVGDMISKVEAASGPLRSLDVSPKDNKSISKNETRTGDNTFET